MQTENVDFIEAFYFAFVTITTIGAHCLLLTDQASLLLEIDDAYAHSAAHHRRPSALFCRVNAFNELNAANTIEHFFPVVLRTKVDGVIAHPS